MRRFFSFSFIEDKVGMVRFEIWVDSWVLGFMGLGRSSWGFFVDLGIIWGLVKR